MRSGHDVNFVNGFRLEEAFSEYKHSPAAGKGVTCQDCHMGTEPGMPTGYATGPAARVGDRCSASTTFADRVASFKDVTRHPQNDRTRCPERMARRRHDGGNRLPGG